MRFLIRYSVFFALLSLFAVPMLVQATPILITDGNGQLIGAENVSVNSGLYDVTFSEGTCAQVFGTCQTSSFAFQSQVHAVLASQALLDQVFLGLFDEDASLTFGCTVTTLCVPLTAYGINGDIVLIANAQNRIGNDPDATGPNSNRASSFNTANNGFEVYARWTDVPEPATLALLGLGMFGLGFSRRKMV